MERENGAKKDPIKMAGKWPVPPKPDRQDPCLPAPVPTEAGAGRKGHNRNIISLLASRSLLRAPGTPRHSGVTLQ